MVLSSKSGRNASGQPKYSSQVAPAGKYSMREIPENDIFGILGYRAFFHTLSKNSGGTE
jgi:hypothetical protein